jgi:hypothetical protein
MRTRLTTTAAALLATAAFVAPAGAQTQDLRSPDTRDAATPAQVAPAQDLRSPDARDVAAGRVSPTVVITPAPQQVVADSSSGFDWGSAAIGAAGILGLLAITAGGVLLVRRHHGSGPPMAPVAS